MKILHTEASSGWGGQEMRILKEAVGMRERGHEVILAVMTNGKLIDQAKKERFTVYEINFKKRAWILSLFRLLWLIYKHKIDLINTHSSLDAWIGAIAAKITRRKVVRTRHLSAKIKPGFNSRILYGYLADYVVTTCSMILPMIAKQSGKSKDLMCCVATGVDPKRVIYKEGDVEKFRKKLKLKPTDFLVGTACFMRSWKGIFDLLKAAEILKNEKDIHWVIIGGGHSEAYIKKAKEMNLKKVVSFTGHLENPFAAIRALDLFTLLSTANEGISQAILQAAYLEKPLLATQTGGLGEVCLDQITGFNVPIFSPEEVAKRVLELKRDGTLRKKFAEEAKKRVLEKYTLKQTIDSMEEIYQQIL